MPETIAAMPETCNWGPCGSGFLVWFWVFAARAVWLRWLCAGIRVGAFAARAVLFGVLVFALASAVCFRAGIRVLPSCFKRRRLALWPLRWRPRYVFVLHALPLCGAAPTFLCRRKEK